MEDFILSNTKNKFFVLTAFIIVFALTLTGCMRTEVGVQLNKNGSGQITVNTLMQTDAYNMMIESGDPYEGKETFTKVIDDIEYIGTSETRSFESADELNSALIALTYDGFTDESQGSDEVIPEEGREEDVLSENEPQIIFQNAAVTKDDLNLFFNADIIPLKENEEALAQGIKINDVYALEISVTMPQKIIEAGGAEISEDGKTSVFKIKDLTSPESIKVSCKTVNMLLAGIITGSTSVVVIIAVTLLIIFIKNKPKALQNAQTDFAANLPSVNNEKTEEIIFSDKGHDPSAEADSSDLPENRQADTSESSEEASDTPVA